MVHVDIDTEYRNYITVQCTDQKESSVVESILSAEKLQEFQYSVYVQDFRVLKKRLDENNLVDREITEEGLERVNEYLSKVQIRSEIKSKVFAADVSGITATKPYTDQFNGIAYIVANQFVGLHDEMGSGKTISTLIAYMLLRKYAVVDKLLVICSNPVKQVWEDEINKHGFNVTYVKCGNGKQIVNGDIKRFVRHKDDVCIIHYEALTAEVIEQLLSIGFDMIVIDEAHMIKNSRSNRSKSVIRIVKEMRRRSVIDQAWIKELGVESRLQNKKMANVVCLTGTPLSENPFSAYPILTVLNHFSVRMKKMFLNYFMEWGKVYIPGYGYVNQPVANRNMDALGIYFEDVSIRRLRSQIKGMPKKVEQIRYVKDVSKEFRELYNKVLEEVRLEIQNEKGQSITLTNAATKLIRLQQILNNPRMLGFEVQSVKYPVIKDIVEEAVESGTKVVIWSIFEQGAELVAKEFENVGSAYITGKVKDDQIQKIRKDFEAGKVNVLSATVQKLGTGVDFLKAADIAIYLEMPVSYIQYKQSQDRLVRRGKTDTVLEVSILVNNSVDVLVKDLLDRKSEWAASVLDSKLVNRAELNKRLTSI